MPPPCAMPVTSAPTNAAPITPAIGSIAGANARRIASINTSPESSPTATVARLCA